MKQTERDPLRFNTLRFLDTACRSKGFSLKDPMGHKSLLEVLAETVSQAQRNGILMHGLRVESMFGYVAGALGHCVAVKQEDAGKFYSANAEIVVPDFRLVTGAGDEFLVEVKNCHEDQLDYRYKLRLEYFRKLRAYADLFKRELKIAIYWSKIELWSLLPAESFEFDGKGYSLSMKQCMMRNEMRIIGDCMVGTVPPLIFRLLADPKKPRSVGPDGQAQLMIGAVEFWSGGRRVDDPFEQKLVWFLMRFGHWSAFEPQAEISDNRVISLQIKVSEEVPKSQGFAIIGSLSQMISSQYNDLTAPEGGIEHLTPSADPSELGIIIPPDYEGTAVRLWRLVVSPNYE